jgi:hypothetical protein
MKLLGIAGIVLLMPASGFAQSPFVAGHTAPDLQLAGAPIRSPEVFSVDSQSVELIHAGDLSAARRRPVLEGAVLGFTAGFLAGAILSSLDDARSGSILVGFDLGYSMRTNWGRNRSHVIAIS